jgi:hypothetical protein
MTRKSASDELAVKAAQNGYAHPLALGPGR